jgi:nucleoporin NUP42
LGAALKQVYDFVLENGTFKDGVMPEVPPKREWVNWEL